MTQLRKRITGHFGQAKWLKGQTDVTEVSDANCAQKTSVVYATYGFDLVTDKIVFILRSICLGWTGVFSKYKTKVDEVLLFNACRALYV